MMGGSLAVLWWIPPPKKKQYLEKENLDDYSRGRSLPLPPLVHLK
jgi:hypothetical protein